MKPETRDRLVESARRLFHEHGYTGTGIAQILDAADARSGSLYYFFPTKEDLLLAVLQKYRELLWPMVIQPVFDRVADPIERVFGVLDGYRLQLLATKYQSGCPIGNLALEVTNRIPAARALIAANFTGWRQVIEQCLGDAAGRLPASVDKEQLAMFVLTTMEGAVMLARTYHSIEPYDAAVTQLRDYFDRLLHDGSNWSPSQRHARSRTSKRRPRPT
ncbi:MAG TPA: TetR/AcrR family transcriptional regulator [Pirellulales bacterium]|nr:TetR/AcrR family transcriptional regulator [Pirellulales bacterium]